MLKSLLCISIKRCELGEKRDVSAYKDSESQSRLLPRKCNLLKHSFKQVKQEYKKCGLNYKVKSFCSDFVISYIANLYLDIR